MTVAEDFRAALHRAGRPMTLRRVDDGVERLATVHGKSSGFRPGEIVGPVSIDDRRIRISALDLADEAAAGRWPADVPPPARLDRLDGAAVQGADPLWDGTTLVGWVVWVNG